MSGLESFMEQYADMVVTSVVFLLILVSFASALHRVRADKPLFAEPPLGALFFETWVSGYSNIRAINLIAHCRNCLHVSVTPTDMQLGLHFPWTLMFFPALTGFDLAIPKSDIVSLERRQGTLHDTIEVTFRNQKGHLRGFSLRLTHSQEFLESMRSADN